MAGTGDAVLDQIQLLVDDLRRCGVRPGLASVVDACTAVAAVDLRAREQVRTALRCTLVTRAEDEPVFDAFFEARFPVAALPRRTTSRPASPDAGLRDRVVDALARADDAALAALARETVEQHGGLEAPSGRDRDRYHLQRALRALESRRLAHDALRARRAGPRRDELVEQLDRTEIVAALDRFLAALAAATRQRRRDVAPDADATSPEPMRVEDLEIATASVVELQQLRRAVRPLARRLAARIARRRYRPLGALDMRRTMRRSLTSGGVPFDPAFRRRTPHRPDLWLLCDVSGSVADFARFTVGLLSAIHDEVPRLRSFLFVDDVVEVTELLAARTHEIDPFALLAGAGAPLGGRRSDWGAAMAQFRDHHRGSLTSRSTVLLTGDARTHDRDPRADVMADLVRRCRGVWLLDPEPRGEWTIGDAAVLAYQRAGVHALEVRTLAQLADAVEHLITAMPGMSADGDRPGG